MPEPAAAVALLGERLGVLRRRVELPVDAVDELLLVIDLLLRDGVVRRRRAGADLVYGQGCGSPMRVRTMVRLVLLALLGK